MVVDQGEVLEPGEFVGAQQPIPGDAFMYDTEDPDDTDLNTEPISVWGAHQDGAFFQFSDLVSGPVKDSSVFEIAGYPAGSDAQKPALDTLAASV